MYVCEWAPLMCTVWCEHYHQTISHCIYVCVWKCELHSGCIMWCIYVHTTHFIVSARMCIIVDCSNIANNASCIVSTMYHSTYYVLVNNNTNTSVNTGRSTIICKPTVLYCVYLLYAWYVLWVYFIYTTIYFDTVSLTPLLSIVNNIQPCVLLTLY